MKLVDRCRQDRGYAVIMTALVLVPLMGFAGFAVDVGAWYSRASSLQRAADAAALAGVVWQPDFAAAESAARAEAARNGFVHGVDGIEVNVTDSGNKQLTVQVIDTDADMFFAGLFLDNVAIGRQAVSEYIDSVPLGSPENRFGTGDDDFGGTATATQFYGAINGYCSGKENGDWLMSGYIGNHWDYCDPPDAGWGVNGDFDSRGYWYAIDKPSGLASSIDVQVRHAGYCNEFPDLHVGGSATFNTVYTLHAADDTPLDDFDNPVFATTTIAPETFCDEWETLFTIPAAGQAGRWFLNVRAQVSDYASGVNAYGIYARVGGSGTPCSSLVSATCPRVYSVGHMGIFIREAGGAADFYLAEIGDEHAGKRAQLTMWDPAEGMSNLRIRDPLGNAVNFTWESFDELNPAHNASGSNTTCGGEPCLDVAARDFNGARVEIVIDLPNSATFATYPDDWWRVTYYAGGGTVTDRTTWSVEILGDPVRLLE